jgi:transcription antitermination factor NusG
LTLALPAPSERVQINAGVLSGQTGEVLRVKTNNQVLVRVESLGLKLVAGLHGSQVSKA